MLKNQVIATLYANRDRLQPFKVKRLYLFGSVVRDDAGTESDIDILVEFDPTAQIGLFALARLQRMLSEMLGRPVDLATTDSLHFALKERILKEAVRAA
jgi:predicted nucleotidyltransferase